MHLTGWRRLFTALLGVWFTAYAAEPADLAACPMHGGTSVVVGHPAHGAPAAAHADHHGSAQPMPTADHAPRDSHDQGPHSCTCLGHCCASSVAAVRTGASPILVAELVAVARAAAPRVNDAAPVAADHTLPFATAPPLA